MHTYMLTQGKNLDVLAPANVKLHSSLIIITHYVFCTNVFMMYVVVCKCIFILEAQIMHTIFYLLMYEF